MECSDLSLYFRRHNPPRVMLEIFEDWLDYVRGPADLSLDENRILRLRAHGQIVAQAVLAAADVRLVILHSRQCGKSSEPRSCDTGLDAGA
jgi:hypothetical protein